MLYKDEKPAKSRKLIDETPGTSGEISTATEAPIELPVPITMHELKKGDFILVKLGAKHWVGYICRKISPTKLETRFLRRKTTKNVENFQFVYPEEDNITKHGLSAVQLLLPKPKTTKGTDRVSSRIVFDI